MILSGAPLSSLPLGAIPNGVDFLVSVPEVGADVDLGGKFARKDLGLLVDRLAGWTTSPWRSWSRLEIPGRPGALKAVSEAREEILELRITGAVEGSSVSDARAKLDAIKALLTAAPIRVITPDAVTRFVLADLGQVTPDPYGPSFRQRKLPIEIVLTAHDPYRYDLVDTAGSGGAVVRIACPLGTGLVRPLLTIAGPATNPVLTLRDWAGTSVALMTFGATTLVAGDNLVIDCSAGSIAKNGSALMSALTAGDFFRLDPLAIADRDKARWPTVETNAGTLTVRYQRTWR